MNETCRNLGFAIVSCVLALACFHAGAQAPVSIVNPSFEHDAFAGTVATLSAPPSGWRLLGEPGIQGLLAPDRGSESETFYPGVTSGHHGAATHFHWNGSSGIEQELSETLRANTRYTLTVASGTRGSQGGAFAGYDIRLITRSGKEVGSWNGALTNLASPGRFADTGRSFETGPNPPGVGESLRIQLRGGSSGYADLDNVRLVASPVAPRAATAPIDVFIVSGQSNSQGWAANASSLSVHNRHYADTPDPRAMLGYRQRIMSAAQDNVGSMGALGAQGSGFNGNFNGFGPELALGSDYSVATAKPVAIIKYSIGSAGLEDNFAKAPAGSPALYPTLIAHVASMLSQLRDRGYDPTLRAVFWLQGETDALSGSGGRYGANIAKFIADVRTDVGAPNLQFYLTQINPNMPAFADGAASAGATQVNNAMIAAAAADSARVFYVRTDHLVSRFADTIHYNADQTIDIGQKWAASYLSHN